MSNAQRSGDSTVFIFSICCEAEGEEINDFDVSAF